MPVSDEHLVGQADAIIAQQHTRAESLATRAAALTGFAAVAATLVLGATPAGGRSFAVGTYLVAAVLGVCIVLGRQLDRRPDMTTVEELGDAEPAFRLRRLILEKTKCVAENEARLRVVEWLWQAHGAVVIVAASATANYLRSL